MRTMLTVLVLALSLGGAASAEPKTKDRKHRVNFDGDMIDGSLMRPEGDLMSVRPEIDLPSLIEPPKSFDRASRKTILAAADAVAPGSRKSKGKSQR